MKTKSFKMKIENIKKLNQNLNSNYSKSVEVPAAGRDTVRWRRGRTDRDTAADRSRREEEDEEDHDEDSDSLTEREFHRPEPAAAALPSARSENTPAALYSI